MNLTPPQRHLTSCSLVTLTPAVAFGMKSLVCVFLFVDEDDEC